MIFSDKSRRVWANLRKAINIIEDHSRKTGSDVFLDYVRYGRGKSVEFVFKYDKRSSNTIAECIRTRRGLSSGVVNTELYDYYVNEFPYIEPESAIVGIC